MEFDNQFTVRAPLDLVWNFMLDANEVTPCVPGAQLTERVDETHFKGTVKVKLGAVQMTYRGEVEMVPNEAARRIELKARGTDTRGGGGASGTITTQLSSPEQGMTRLDIHSKVDVTGRVAQFGRGIMQDVANRLMKDFAACLERKIQTQAEASVEAVENGEPAASRSHEDPGEQVPAALAGAATTEVVVSTEGTAPVVSPQSSGATGESGATADLSLSKIIVDVLRARAAAGLRSLAKRIEPS